MTDTTLAPLTLKLTGSRIASADVPALLRPGAVRGGPAVADQFLPEGYLRVMAAYDLSATGRSAPGAASDIDLAVKPGEVLVLELPDGTTLITSGTRLRDELQRVAPEASSQDTIRLDDVLPRGAASRGLLDSLGRLVARVSVLEGGVKDGILDEAIEEVRKTAGDALADKLLDGALWSIDYRATRALMWAIEKRVRGESKLYRWADAGKGSGELVAVDPQRLAQDATQGVLVFIHGTASSTEGSFGKLREDSRDAQLDWDEIEARYGERVYAFEHLTFSESPIENALKLAATLPAGARVDLVTHSRGGIVGDLLCVDWTDPVRSGALIDGYRRFRTKDNADAKDLEAADGKDRADLKALAKELATRQFTVGRYVRVAAPVSGTLLAGSNLDLFLSGLLTLVGAVTTLATSPIYMALKRIVLEIARNRADASRVPGLEAMLPGSAVSRLLRLAEPAASLQLGVIAGDIEGASRFKRLVEFLADWVIYARNDNDLVVDTASMETGVARPGNAKRLFVQGSKVDHFSYFGNADSREALTQWLTAADPRRVPGFDPLGRALVEPRGAAEALRGMRGALGARPVVIVLPGIMGSHLQIGSDRIWFDPLDIARGRLHRIAYTDQSLDAVSPEKLFSMFYGDLCQHLARTHDVVPYPYDWRRPVHHAAIDLARELRAALEATAAHRQPVRILAHSMGGLVTRALAAAEPALWREFMSREGARFVMLGTPNQGSHLMVEMLVGKGDTVRKLTMLDVRHDLQQTLDLIAGFRGALQLLPRTGFRDSGGTPVDDYLRPAVWQDLKSKVSDFWFGDGIVGVPSEAACAEAKGLWSLPDFGEPRVPGEHPEKVVYVCGKAENTACGIDLHSGRMKMVGTPEGDGSVSWASGRIDGIGEAYLMDAPHGDLASTEEHFDALEQLLSGGATAKLPRGWPSALARGQAAPATIIYDAGPAAVPTDEELARSLVGAGPRRRAAGRRVRPTTLQVSVAAMDLRHANDPVLVGHYERDPIAGAEAIIDRDVVASELTLRNHLGMYPGAVGTATVVLQTANEEEQRRGTQRGAVVTGLGEWGTLNSAALTEAVRAAALRYLLTVVERRAAATDDAEAARAADAPPLEVGLASLLLGYNSTANISIADSVNALLRGVLEANRQFALAQRRGLKARIVRLEIVELYLDVAISATKALQGIAQSLAEEADQLGMRVAARAELVQRHGMRPRLEAVSGAGYWPRLIVTGVDARQPRPAEGSAAAPTDAPQRLHIAEKLKYVYLAQRARAESEVLQRQPGLIEKLVSLSIDQPAYNADLSRTLFHLMVPLEFKEAARQTDRLNLLLDEYTANFPWELLAADERPLATRTAMVRQFVSTDWRKRVRATVDKTAYVIGNPSTQGFSAAFPNKANKGTVDPQPLPGAEQEAYAVVDVLRQAGFDSVTSIGESARARDIVNRLFQKPYRIIHVAAHGEFDLEAADGTRRSGVLLSEGLMLTAAEINQMEIVPDLVFLNCCHLGKIDDKAATRDVAFNRLASSLARQLIDMGVRAVVAAGWAVDDLASKAFAEAFYTGLLSEGLPFGLAIHKARLLAYGKFRNSNTWGAYQAYGDPGFLIDPTRPQGSAAGFEPPRFAAPQELIDALAQLREGLQRQAGRGTRQTLRGLQRDVDALLARCPDGADWARRGDVRVEIGLLYGDLGEDGFAAACEALLGAVGEEEMSSRVPLRAIELLANLESRAAEDASDAEAIRRSVERIDSLLRAVANNPEAVPTQGTPERCALLGGVHKRLAAARARTGRTFDAELRAARDWYERGTGTPDSRTFNTLCAFNRLMLDALLKGPGEAALARAAGEVGRRRFVDSRDYWDAMAPADARFTEALCDGTLDVPAADLSPIIAAYRQARRSVAENARSWNSLMKQYDVLTLFAERLGRAALAANLRALAAVLRVEGEGEGGEGGGTPAGGGGAAPAAPARGRTEGRRGRVTPPARARGAEATFSRFFTLAELTRSVTAIKHGIANDPGPVQREHLQALCAAVLDPLREAIGSAIKVNSGYRSPALNRRIGGAPTSQHVEGKAADIQSPGLSVLGLFQAVIRGGLPFDQLIYEARDAVTQWVHVSHNPGGNRGEIRVAKFDTSGRPVDYRLISAEAALAMSEPVSRAAGKAIEFEYHEMGDEPQPAMPTTRTRGRTRTRSAVKATPSRQRKASGSRRGKR